MSKFQISSPIAIADKFQQNKPSCAIKIIIHKNTLK